jgi:hypothetical protein
MECRAMRRLSPFAALAAFSLILSAAPDDAAAGGRGHGFAGKGGRAHFSGRHHGFRHGLHRGHRFGSHHGRFHGRFRHGPLFAGFAPGYLDGGRPPLYIQNVANSAASNMTVLDLPGSTGIRSEPAAQPIIYVIKGPERRHEPPLMRKGSRERPGAKVLALNPGREVAATGSAAPHASGPRIVEVTARRGL